MRDTIDLSKITKKSNRISLLNTPPIIGAGVALFFLIILKVLLGFSFLTAVIVAIVNGLLITIGLYFCDNGYTALYRIVMGFYVRNRDKIFNKDTKFLNYADKSIKDEKDYQDIAKKLKILGVKENMIKQGIEKWASCYKIVPAILPNTVQEAQALEDNLKEIENILHKANCKFQIIFNQKQLKSKKFKKYQQAIKNSSNTLETLKEQHIEDIEKTYYNTTLSSFLDVTLIIYTKIPNKFLRNNALHWSNAKQEMNTIFEEIDNFSNISITKMQNKELKSFILTNYCFLEPIDYRDSFEEEKIKDEKVKEEKAVEDIEEKDETLKDKIKKIIKKFKIYVSERTELNNINKDILFYLPDGIHFDNQNEYVKVSDWYETTFSIPTTNKIINDELIKHFFRFNSVYAVSIKLVPQNKNKIINKLETAEKNNKIVLREEQETKNKSGTIYNRDITEVSTYLEEISSDNSLELFKLCFTVSIATKTRGELKEELEKIKLETYNRLGIKIHKALFEQDVLYMSAKLGEEVKIKKLC